MSGRPRTGVADRLHPRFISREPSLCGSTTGRRERMCSGSAVTPVFAPPGQRTGSLGPEAKPHLSRDRARQRQRPAPLTKGRSGSSAAHLRCVRLGARRVGVVVVPPLVWRGLGIALRRVLPLLLATERGDVEIAPGASHRLIATAV